MRRIILAALFAALLVVLPRAARAFTPPTIQGYVTDTAGELSAEEVRALDEKLAAYRKCAGDRIAVLVVRSLEGAPIEDVGYATAQAWKLGEAGKDNGVLLVIAPNERKDRIEVGRGLEGQLTDLQSNDILRGQVSPNLKKNDFFAAIDEGTTAIAGALWSSGPHASCASIAHATRPPHTAVAPTRQPPSAPPAAPALANHDIGFGPAIGFFIACFALAWRPREGGSGGASIVLFALVFGVLGSAFVTTMFAQLVGDRPTCMAVSILAAVVAVLGRALVTSYRRRTFSGSSDSSSSSSSSYSSSSYSSSSSSFDFGSSSSSDSSFSSGGGGSDSGFSGGDGGSFGGGGSSDSY